MTVMAAAVVIATCFLLGMLIGVSATGHTMRRRIHRNGTERREIHMAFAALAEARAALADERRDLDRRRRLLDD